MTGPDDPRRFWRGILIGLTLAIPLWAGFGLVCYSLYLMWGALLGGS